jgi:hypothetical protein
VGSRRLYVSGMAFAPESVLWLSQITPADTRHSPSSQTPDGVFGTHRASRAHPPPRCQRSLPAKPATCSVSTRM